MGREMGTSSGSQCNVQGRWQSVSSTFFILRKGFSVLLVCAQNFKSLYPFLYPLIETKQGKKKKSGCDKLALKLQLPPIPLDLINLSTEGPKNYCF